MALKRGRNRSATRDEIEKRRLHMATTPVGTSNRKQVTSSTVPTSTN